MIKKYSSILLVDDDEINNILTKDLFRDLNIAEEVLTFCSGEETLEYLTSISGNEAKCPEVIFLDLNMPTMDGEEFLKEFNALSFPNKDKIKIIILSALLPSNKYNYLKTLGVEDFIEKPLSDEKIALIMKKLGFPLAY